MRSSPTRSIQRLAASGATGKTHDWRVSRRLVEVADKPVILAGGLNPENVKRAILEVRPAGVDSHSGDRIGPERCVFESDFPARNAMEDALDEINEILEGKDVNDKHKAMILG
jgi:hypothetical protein